MAKIVLADDHGVLREGLAALIERNHPDIEVVGQAATGREAVALACQLTPDVVVMDICMEDMNGIEATRQISRDAPDVRVIGLSMRSERQFVTRMLSAGAAGYVLKDCGFGEVAAAIRAVMAGKVYLSAAVSTMVVRDYVQHLREAEPELASELTPREREVLQLVAEGQSTRAIADKLHVSVKTIETHRRATMGRLGLHSIAELTKYAIREGLTSLDR